MIKKRIWKKIIKNNIILMFSFEDWLFWKSRRINNYLGVSACQADFYLCSVLQLQSTCCVFRMDVTITQIACLTGAAGFGFISGPDDSDFTSLSEEKAAKILNQKMNVLIFQNYFPSVVLRGILIACVNSSELKHVFFFRLIDGFYLSSSISDTWKNCLEGATDFKEVAELKMSVSHWGTAER